MDLSRETRAFGKVHVTPILSTHDLHSLGFSIFFLFLFSIYGCSPYEISFPDILQLNPEIVV
jgi:hypothetical protein